MQQLDFQMTREQKKAFLLLKAIIFQHHGLDETERHLLQETAENLAATAELDWVTDFIASDTYTAFERARTYLASLTETLDNDVKLSYLSAVWESTNQKGHITEIEATAMLRIAKDWKVQRDFMMLVRKG